VAAGSIGQKLNPIPPALDRLVGAFVIAEPLFCSAVIRRQAEKQRRMGPN
jgi:hypothetical protein